MPRDLGEQAGKQGVGVGRGEEHPRGFRQHPLSEAAGMLLSTADADALFPGLFAKIARHLDVDAYCNFMVNEARDAISVESSQGLPEAALHALMRLKFRQDLHDGIVLSDRPLVL